MKTEYDDIVKEYIPFKNGDYLVIVKDHDGDNDIALSKKVKSQQFKFASLILAHTKALLNDVILVIGRFNKNKWL